MFGKILKSSLNRFVRKNATAAVASSQQSTRQELMNFQCTQLNNGMKVVSSKEFNDLSRAVIVLNSGARFEEGNEAGITHVIRHVLFGSNVYYTHITNTRCLLQVGSDVSVECTRDNIIIKAAFGSRYLFNVLDFIGTALSYNKFYYWEVAYALQSCLIDYDNVKANLIPENLFNELHSKLFRQGYGNSLFVKPDCESKIREYNVAEYFKKHINSNRMVLAVQSDVSHEFIEEYAEECFRLPIGSKSPTPDVRTYTGETIIDLDWRNYHSVMGYSAPSENHPSWATYKVLQKYFGVCETKPAARFTFSRLGAHLQNLYPVTKTSSFYMPYNHAGLFGFYTVSGRNDFANSIKSVCTGLKNIFNEEVKPEAVMAAKQAAKLDLACSVSTKMDGLADVASVLSGSQNPLTLDARMKQIDAVAVKDVKAALKQLSETRPVVVSSGNPVFVPPADEMIYWLKK